MGEQSSGRVWLWLSVAVGALAMIAAISLAATRRHTPAGLPAEALAGPTTASSVTASVATSAVTSTTQPPTTRPPTTAPTTSSIDPLTSAGYSTFDLKIGDCLDSSLTGEIDTVDLKPCTGPHQFEVYHTFDLPDAASFPGEDDVKTQADTGCLDAFRGYVGVDYNLSSWDISTLTPTLESWQQIDDRTVICLVGQPGDAPTTGSAKGTGR